MIRRIKRSLMLKWTLFSIFLATIPLSIAGFRITQIYQADLKKSVIEIEGMKANLVVGKTVSFFDRATDDLYFIARHENIREVRPSLSTRRSLEEFLYKNDCLVELALLNQEGREIVRVSKDRVYESSDLKEQSKSEMFGRTLKGEVYYGDFYLTPDMVPTLVVAIPIKRGRDKIVGALIGRIHLRYLWNLLSSTQIGKKGSTFVVNGEGDLIAHPDTRRVLLGLNVRHLPVVNSVILGEEGDLEFEDPQKGEKYLGVYKPIKGLNWGVIVQVPVDEAYAPVMRVANTAFKWILIALGVAIVLGVLLARKLILPVKNLSTGMGEVAKGNLDASIQPTTRDELGHLTESFNKMILDLKRSQESLREAEEKYRRIFENSKDMVFMTSLDGEFVDVNQAGVTLLGYENREALLGNSVVDTYLRPEDRVRFQREMTREGFVKDFEVKLKKKDGMQIDCLITGSVRRNIEGRITGYEGIIKNISDRKRMEEQLVHRTEELEVLYELSRLIHRSLDLNDVLTDALGRLLDITGFEMGGIYLLQNDGATLEFKYHQGYTPAFVDHVKVIQLGEGISGESLRLRKPILIGTDEYPSMRLAPFLTEEGIRYSMSIPLLGKVKVIGAVNLSTRFDHTDAPREMSLIESIGNQIGLALENAQLFSNVAKAKSEWETTFDAVTDLITIRDKDYRILRANKSAFERFGLEPQEMIGKRCYEILHHREGSCAGCYVAKTLATRKPASGERESPYLNGIFQYFTFPVFNESEEIVAVVDLAREVTEAKRTELEKEVVNNINKILASSLDVRQVMKSVHRELKRVLDSERMTITLANEGGKGFQYFALEKDYDAEELVGGICYPHEETPFKGVVDTGQPLIISETGESDSWINRKLFREGIRSSLVFPLKYKERIIGTLNFGSTKPHHFSERHSDLLHQVAPGLTISIENSLLLNEIKESEEKYRTVVEAAHDGVCMIAENYRFTYLNERMAELLGYSKDESIGMDFREMLDDKSREVVVDRYVRRQRGEEVPSRYEFNILRKNREIRNVEVSSTVIKDLKGQVSTISFVKDISEKKKMEEQLVQAEKLRALGEMASGVAHDFNNALAVILGNTQLLQLTAKDEDLRETLRTIEKVAKDSAQTVRRLQDFTRKKVHQEFFKLDINSIVQDAMEITRPKWKDEAQGKGILIEMVSQLGTVSPVAGTASELREVVTNMIFNAIEAMPQGGKIELQTFQKREKVHIQISDTGAGMVEEVRKKVFDPFFTTKPFTNTGLGLSMSYGIVQRFGGEIEVESRPGMGTTFTIVLPVGSGEKEETPVVSPAIQKGKRGRILVIDDEEAVRNVLSRILTQVDHQVTVARDGEEGIRSFREGTYDLVLTDLGMPGLSGWDVCRMVKRESPGTPVGMITGWGMELSKSSMEDCGLDFLISKPFEFGQVLKIVGETIKSLEGR